MKLIFDSALATERSFIINDFYEDINADGATLNAVYHCSVDAETIFPDYAGLETLQFISVEIVNEENIVIPQNHAYTKIQNISVTYNDKSKVYPVNIILN